MLSYIMRRILATLPVMGIVALFVFSLLYIAPGDPDSPAGSSDIGNLSQLLPAIHPYIQVAAPGTPSHSEAMREAAATPFAHDRAQIAATGLASVVADLLTDPDLLAAAQAEFAGQTPVPA